MTNTTVFKTEGPVSGPIRHQTRRPYRILMVDDEAIPRRIHAKALVDYGYQVEDADDGDAAWQALQFNSYDLLITDNNMPKVTGVELIKKVRSARMALPIIMATATVPHECIHEPAMQPTVVLLKPFTFGALLATVGIVLRLVASVSILLCFAGALSAQEQKADQQLPPQLADNSSKPTAITVTVRGECDYSEEGGAFAKLERGQILSQGATIRTGQNAQADLFFRRTGTTVRLQPATEIRLEQMTLTVKDGLPVVRTLLDLREGRIFTVVRSIVPGSEFEIRNAAGRAVVEGSGIGRYIITADGTHVSAKGSVIPLKVVGENGITVIAAGEQFSKKDGKMLPLESSVWVKDLIQLDELDALTEAPATVEPSPKP